MKKFVCPVCGYVHEGNEPPEKCPQCGVDGSKFTEATGGKLEFACEHVIGVGAKDKIDAENNAYVTRTQAEAERDARIAKADAEKAELEAKAAGLNDYVIQQQWIQKWDGKLIPNFGGNNGLNFTDWTDIIKQYLVTDAPE